MNSKIIAAGVVVALCAVALIGVGYAYTATVESPNNNFDSEYIVVQVGSDAQTLFSNKKIEYSTTTTSSGVEYKTVAAATPWTSDYKVKITNPKSLTLSSVTVKVEISKSSLLVDENDSPTEVTTDDTDYSILFVSGDDKATASLGTNSQSAVDGGTSIYWQYTSVPVNSELEFTLNYLPDVIFDGSLTKGPSDLTIPITITVTAS